MELSEEQKIFFETMAKELPPFIARDRVSDFFGGLISRPTMASKDCLGGGPKVKYRMGKKVVYPREDLLMWFIENYSIQRLKGKADL